MLRRAAAAVVWGVAAVAVLPGPLMSNDLSRDEEIVFFPTYAPLDDGAEQVELPLHGWIFEREANSSVGRATSAVLAQLLQLDAAERQSPLYVERMQWFLVDNERRQRLVVRLGERQVEVSPSEENGHVRTSVVLPTADVRRWATAQSPGPAELDYRAVTPPGDARTFAGRVHLIAAEGWSVVSDIDDTIKISQVADKRELIRNTFVREFRPVPGMAEVYAGWRRAGAALHYVSGSPWQLYAALEAFRAKHGFPAGSFDLRHFRISDGSALDMLAGPADYKLRTIDAILQAFPRRKFVLVGDSGESDPEVYGELARRRPTQVRLIAVRNVTGETPESKRMQAAFRDVPPERVLLFDQAAQLPTTFGSPMRAERQRGDGRAGGNPSPP